MRAGALIASILLGFLGFLFTGSFVGALVGIPMLLIGFVLFIYALVAKEPTSTVVIQSGAPATPSQTPTTPPPVTIRPSATLYCRYCGALGPADAKYCRSCGKPQA